MIILQLTLTMKSFHSIKMLSFSVSKYIFSKINESMVSIFWSLHFTQATNDSDCTSVVSYQMWLDDSCNLDVMFLRTLQTIVYKSRYAVKLRHYDCMKYMFWWATLVIKLEMDLINYQITDPNVA